MTDLSGLIERVEKATGPDRELDEAIWIALNLPTPLFRYAGAHGRDWPPLTSSIDTAIALVEKVLPGCAYRIQRNLDGSLWAELQRRSSDGPLKPFDVWSESGNRPTLPLAILLALFRALSAKGSNNA